MGNSIAKTKQKFNRNILWIFIECSDLWLKFSFDIDAYVFFHLLCWNFVPIAFTVDEVRTEFENKEKLEREKTNDWRFLLFANISNIFSVFSLRQRCSECRWVIHTWECVSISIKDDWKSTHLARYFDMYHCQCINLPINCVSEREWIKLIRNLIHRSGTYMFINIEQTRITHSCNWRDYQKIVSFRSSWINSRPLPTQSIVWRTWMENLFFLVCCYFFFHFFLIYSPHIRRLWMMQMNTNGQSIKIY